MISYLVGGKDHFPVDREFAEKILHRWPDLRNTVIISRAWVIRAVGFMASDLGVGQFLNIGPGLPADENVHQVAQRSRPDARVAYADRDPNVLIHGRALLATDDRTGYIDSDLLDVEKVLTHAREMLDWGQPIGLIFGTVLNFIPTSDDPASLVSRYMNALPPGSYLAISHACSDNVSPEVSEMLANIYQGTLTIRSSAEISALFSGAHLVEPGLVRVQDWRPEIQVPALTLNNLGAIAGPL